MKTSSAIVRLSVCQAAHTPHYTLLHPFHSCTLALMRYSIEHMNKTLTGFIVVIILAVLGGGAYYYFKMMPKATPDATTPTTQDTTIPQDKVQAQEVTAGTGAEAAPGTVVSVLYEGKLQDGTTFDSSAAHGNQPLVFTLGSQGLIPGFQIGVNGMKVGGERIIAIPAALGYGAQDVKDADGKVIIPANSTLLFNIKLVKVEAAPAATSTAPSAPAKN